MQPNAEEINSVDAAVHEENMTVAIAAFAAHNPRLRAIV
jgi:hypothetical protein